LIRIQQNRLHDAGLEPRVTDIRPRGGAHERGAKDDGEVLRAHAVGAGIVHDAVQVQRQGAQGGVVGVGQAVNDGVERVAADRLVLVFCGVGLATSLFGKEGGQEGRVLAASIKAE
jgi:hypothetical protein